VCSFNLALYLPIRTSKAHTKSWPQQIPILTLFQSTILLILTIFVRQAHVQRIISDAICEYIWKPLRSEFTLLHPEVNSMLSKLSDQLRNSNRGGRSANVWTALTMRALESLPPEQEQARIAESQDISQVVGSARADRVISRVISVLSPLVGLSQIEALRRDLDKLAKSAIDVWNSSQKSGELNITVNQLLEREHREEWRSPQFDPAASSRGQDEADFDAISRTRPRIITLFPRVVASRVVDLVSDEKSPPGASRQSRTRRLAF
jgi:hypothetical protein